MSSENLPHEGKEVTLVWLPNRSGGFQEKYICACAEGFEKLGAKVYIRQNHFKYGGTKNIVIWGYHYANHYPTKNKIIMEMGYLGDRMEQVSIATNGLNGLGSFHSIVNDRGKRFNKSFKHLYKPWNPEGEYILLIGQTPNDMSLYGSNIKEWYNFTTKRLKKVFPDIPIYFRQHPNLSKRGLVETVEGTIKSEGTLQEAMEKAKLVVCFNSNTGVDALLAGKPLYVEDQRSMCYSIANTDLDNICFKEPQNRKRFFNRLAYCQWTLEEIKEGTPLKDIPLE